MRLPTTSEFASLDYRLCVRCRNIAVGPADRPRAFGQDWVVGRRMPSLIFLYIYLELGLLYADLGHISVSVVERQRLKQKGLMAFETVGTFIPKVAMDAENHDRLSTGLRTLGQAIEKIPA